MTAKQTALLGAAALLAILGSTVQTNAQSKAPSTPSSVGERIEQSRNLGKAFYENSTTSAEAVAEFKKALDLAPNSDREKLNYALALMHALPDILIKAWFHF